MPVVASLDPGSAANGLVAIDTTGPVRERHLRAAAHARLTGRLISRRPGLVDATTIEVGERVLLAKPRQHLDASGAVTSTTTHHRPHTLATVEAAVAEIVAWLRSVGAELLVIEMGVSVHFDPTASMPAAAQIATHIRRADHVAIMVHAIAAAVLRIPVVWVTERVAYHRVMRLAGLTGAGKTGRGVETVEPALCALVDGWETRTRSTTWTGPEHERSAGVVAAWHALPEPAPVARVMQARVAAGAGKAPRTRTRALPCGQASAWPCGCYGPKRHRKGCSEVRGGYVKQTPEEKAARKAERHEAEARRHEERMRHLAGVHLLG